MKYEAGADAGLDGRRRAGPQGSRRLGRLVDVLAVGAHLVERPGGLDLGLPGALLNRPLLAGDPLWSAFACLAP